MTFDLEAKFPGKATAADTDYPYASARNVTATGDGTGTPWDYDLINDWLGFFQSMLIAGGVTPSGISDTALDSDYYDALTTIINNQAPVEGAWQTPTLTNIWAFGTNPLRYRLSNRSTYLEIFGAVNGASASSPSAFYLPAGYRLSPLSVSMLFLMPTSDSSDALLTMSQTGEVTISARATPGVAPTSTVNIYLRVPLTTPF